jgi:hypothetical protein
MCAYDVSRYLCSKGIGFLTKHVCLFQGTREQRGDNGMMFLNAIATDGSLNLNSKEHVQQDHILHSGFGLHGVLAMPEPSSDNEEQKITRKKQKRRLSREPGGEDGDDRTREHPFIVTEPGEVARGKKNGLDYLFDLYEQCSSFLDEVQQMSRERGEKCPTKVFTNITGYIKGFENH